MSLKALRKLAKEARDLRKQTKEVLQKPKQTSQGTGQQEFKQTRKAYKLFVQRDDGGLYPLFVDADTRIPEKVFTEANFPKEAFQAPNGRLYVPSKGAKRTKGEKKQATGESITIPDEKTRKLLIEKGYITDRVKRTEEAPFGKVTAVAARPGYHASQKPVATHIGPQDLKVTSKEVDKLLKAGITPEAIRKRKGQLYVKRRAEDQVFAEVEMADDVDYQSILANEGKTDINDKVPLGGSYSYVDGQADSDNWVVGGNMRVNRVLSKDEVKNIQQQEGVKDLPYKDEVENILGRKFAEGGLVEGDDMQQGVDDYVVAKTESEGMEMNIGGAPRKNLEAQQLEMFGDIGMAKSTAKKDPVSGNEIPKASTAEEVRDDIPAQLSEGEFVLPADVVRYHGLEKLMKLRQQAKQGINTMDKMGQLGNADEATMPDDLPFDINDIEMAEGGFVNVAGQPMQLPKIAGKQIEMQTGGIVTPTATGTFQIPTQLSSTPSYFQNYAQTTAPFSPFAPKQQTLVPPTSTPIPNQKTPTFQDLIPSQGQRPVTIEYRNAAGQRLFIPFINGKPIYPIPEGYTRYIAEEEPIAKDKPVTPTTTQVTTGEGSNDVLSETSQVRGLDNSIVDTNFANKSPEQVSKSMENLSTSDRGKAVMNALDQAKGQTGLARGLQQLGMAVVPGALTAGMIGQKTLDPRGVLSQVGKPNPEALNSILNAYGPSTVGLSPEEIDMQGIDRNEALSQAMYGMSYEAATRALGVAPSFTKGYKNGQVDPTTGATYSHGQAGDPFGVPSYASIDDFGKAMAASAATGFYGSLATAKAIAMDPTKSAKEKEKAIAFGKQISPFFEMEIDDRTDTEVASDLDAISQDPDVESKAEAEKSFDVEETFGSGESTSTSTGTGTSMGASDMGLGDISTDNEGGSAESDSDCVIATHGLSTGGFTAIEKAKAELWCQKTYHGKWYGEAFRKGYRAAGMKHINAGTAPSVYQEFKDFVAYGRGIKKGWKIGFNYYLRTITFFIHGLFIK